MATEGVPEAAVEAAIALAEERTGHVANEALFAEIVAAAYPAVRDQVLAEVREALAKKSAAHRALAVKAKESGDPMVAHEYRGHADAIDIAAEDVVAALATLSPSEDTTEGVTQADLDRGEELDKKFGWSEGSDAPLPEACEKRDAAEAETKAAESRCKGLTQALSTVLGFLDMDDAETHKGIAENCGVDACIVCLAEEVARTALKEH